MNNDRRPPLPGEVFQDENLGPLGMTVDAFAQAMRVLAPDIEALIDNESSITPDMAERLSEHFGGDAQSWLTLQAEYDRKQRLAAQQPPAPDTSAPLSGD